MNVLLQSLLVCVSQQCAVPRLNRLSEIGSCGWARHLFIFHCLPSFSFTLSRAAHVLWFDTGSIRSLIVLFISYIRALYCTSACLHHDANNSNKKQKKKQHLSCCITNCLSHVNLRRHSLCACPRGIPTNENTAHFLMHMYIKQYSMNAASQSARYRRADSMHPIQARWHTNRR